MNALDKYVKKDRWSEEGSCFLGSCPGLFYEMRKDLGPGFGRGWLLLAVFFLAMVGCARTETIVDSEEEVQPAPRITVRLTVNFNGRSENSAADIEVPDDTSVFGVLSKGFPGEIEHSGQGDRLFVKSIHGVANEGAGGDNWTYRVNGELGKVSSGICPVTDGDVIEWTLGKYTPDE